MNEYLEVLLDALVDTAKILPLLFAVYYLIELLEFKYAVKMQNSKLLKGKVSPVIGALIGSIPQCGFSVVSSDLFSKRMISIGALISVYIATSDEAIPLMISNPEFIGWMCLLIVVKIVYAIVIGYASIWLYNVIFKRKATINTNNKDNLVVEHGGCCHHHVESKAYDWLHPLLHCLKIALFIFIINLAFGLVTDIWVGEDRLKDFLSSTAGYQPLLAVLIGLIPNCASSVVLTELYLVGGLKFGALVAGLCVNAGLGLVMLIKQNKDIKENIFIFTILIISGLMIGYGLLFI